MKRSVLLLFVCGICCTAQAQAQVAGSEGGVSEKRFSESALLPHFDAETAERFDADLEAMPIVSPLQMATPASWQSQVVEALSWQRRMAPNQVAQQTVSPSVRQEQKQYKKGKRSRDINEEVGQWRISVGNTGTKNWSEFPDRALDARTLSFPLPKKR